MKECVPGRPQSIDISSSMEMIYNYLENSEDCQFSLQELIDQIDGYVPHERTIKQKLKEKYMDDIIITVNKKKIPTVCFRNIGHKILSDNWYTSRKLDERSEKLRIVKKAAEIIKCDIADMVYEDQSYPQSNDFLNNIEGYVPESLTVFLEQLIIDKRKTNLHSLKKKCIAIGHSIIAAAKPRTFNSPLQLSIASYIYKKVGSKNLVQMLSRLGICSSYADVQTLEASIIMAPPEVIEPRAFCQFVFDNCDFNVCTIDGYNTFHNMAGIRCITPASSITYRSDVIEKYHKLKKSEIVEKKVIVDVLIFEKKEMGLQNFVFEDLDHLFPSKEYNEVPSIYDALWMCGKWKGFDNIPGWQGYMEKITFEENFDQSKILLLPFIMASPSDYNTVHTSLMMAVEKSKELNIRTTFVTFDQPLYMTAVDIVLSAGSDSQLSNVIIRLGGFHLLMSFLGCIGFIMKGSGLKELLSTIYAPNSVDKMLTGQAYSRAIRGNLLVQLALAKVVLNDIDFTDEELGAVEEMFSEFQESPPSRKTIEDECIFKNLAKKLEQQLQNIDQLGATASLWVQYFNMVTLVKNFIEAERAGDWEKHLYTVKLMIPYFHASGHFHYAKSCQIYLQRMSKLKEKMDAFEYGNFVSNGYFTIRRHDKFFSGTWTDMCIEQSANKGFKIKGGVIHRGFTEDILTAHVVASPTLHGICEAIEEYCGIDCGTSEQHVESRESRIKRNDADVIKLNNWLNRHNPFVLADGIMSLSSGIIGDESINCHQAKKNGEQCMGDIIGKPFKDIKLKRSNTVSSLATINSAVKVNSKVVAIDPLIIFQRMLIAKKHYEDLLEYFEYELAPYPLSLFNETSGMRKTRKSALYEMFQPIDENLLRPGEIYVIDGGYLLHRVSWQINKTYGEICARYVNHVKNNFGENSCIVFDGYGNDRSTKKVEQQRRYFNNKCADILFDENMIASVSQEKFLSNDKNKIRLISMLTKAFENEGMLAKQASDDADVLIVETAIEMSNTGRTSVVGEDIDLLILIIALTPENNDIMLVKPGTGKVKRKIFSSSDIQKNHEWVRQSILLAHAFSGCDTTSSIFQKGKLKIFKLLQKEKQLESVVTIFNDFGSTPSQKSKLELLPPTSEAAAQHSFRVFHQIQTWLGNKKNPEEWGWTKMNGLLQPTTTLLAPAPESILQLISCNCTTDCHARCSCKKAGLKCSSMCGNCQGVQCLNAYSFESIAEREDENFDSDDVHEETDAGDIIEEDDPAYSDAF